MVFYLHLLEIFSPVNLDYNKIKDEQWNWICDEEAMSFSNRLDILFSVEIV